MKIPSINISRQTKFVIALFMVVLWIFVRYHISQMDERFFQPSLLGFKGLALYEIGDYSGAAKAYRSHLRKEFQLGQTTNNPGWDALLKGDIQTAKELSTKAIKDDPFAIDSLLALGEIALEERAYDQALEIFDRVLQQDSNQFDASFLSSVVYTHTGNYGKAIDFLNRALRNNYAESWITSFLQALETTGNLTKLPKEKRPLCLLAHYYRYLRIYDPSNGSIAMSYAKKAIKLGDRPDDAYFTLGVIYEKQGKSEKALDTFLKTTEVNPNHAEAYRRAAQIYSNMGNLSLEYQMRKAAFEAAPNDPFYAGHLIYFLSNKLGDYYQALALALRSLEVNPEDVIALNRVGDLYGFLGNQKSSLQYYRMSLSLNSRNPSVYEKIGRSLREMGKKEEAIKFYRKAIEINPGLIEAHIGLAHIYRDQRHYNDAIQEYEEGFRLGETNIAQRTNLCTLYYQAANYQQATDCLRQVLSEDPNNIMAKRLLPYVLENLRVERSSQ